MAPRLQLEKEAWLWAERVDPENISQEHVETAYRVKLKGCKIGACRRNCKGNPNCLVGLGEKEWLCEISDESWVAIDDPNNERRHSNSFVGLKNLGATCYVNSLLQLWYHNPKLRKAVYQWKPEDDPQESQALQMKKKKGDSSNLTDDDYTPTTYMGHLQLIFALLQFSSRRYIDPSEFIKSLGLNTAEQQDAQEFSKLFMNLLEEKLQHQKTSYVRTIMQEQFRGEYEYITSCTKCGKNSIRPSSFYELDLNIKGYKDLDECIKEFLQEEKLEGTNQYFCSFCQSKQNATRKIKLLQLPPVLNLQLLCFVFDRNTGFKKKLNYYIRFPEILDMSKYLDKEENEVLYDLSAVLIHRGSSANSGHYIAHIRDRISGSWFKFNDETIEKMEGKNLKLGNEEEVNEGANKGAKTPKAVKGHHTSQNAYMLVYTRQQKEKEALLRDDSDEWDLPEFLQECVIKDNSRFEEWVTDLVEMRKQNVQSGKAKQTEIQNLYNMLPVKDEESYEWIPTDWLMQWLDNNSEMKQFNNTEALCVHNKLHPDHVSKMKRISKEAANVIYSLYGGGPRLTRDALCQECVIARCHQIRTKVRVQEDNKFITHALKAKLQKDENAFWIGRSSLRRWRKLVMDQFTAEADANDNSEGSLTENGHDGCKQSESEDDPSDLLGTDSDVSSFLGFNEEIMCVHNNLSIKENNRRLIPEEVWKRLKKYFPSAPEFSRLSASCQLCQEMKAEDLQLREIYRLTAAEQKAALSDLYLDKNRPIGKRALGSTLYVMNTEFVEEWKKFIREPSRRDPVQRVDNSALLCPHGGLMYLPEIANEDDVNKKITLVWGWEWQAACRLFEVDREISVAWQCDAGGGEEVNADADANAPAADARISSALSTIVCSPSVCNSCHTARKHEEQLQMLDYVGAKIFVRKVSSNFNTDLPWASSCDGSDQEDGDPEFFQAGVPRKRKKMMDVTEKPFPDLVSNSQQQVRRSMRHRRMRGEKEILVSSAQTLRDLKLQIMKMFSVAPFDQHLTLNGRELTDNQATLASLHVLPGSLILLKADEPMGDPVLEEDFIKATAPEEGFKGTELLRS